jgi:hypothetical protein
VPYPTPHYEKLSATLNSDKLPEVDKSRVEAAILQYRQWITELDEAVANCNDPAATLNRMIASLNKYRRYIDIELVFDSPDDFLYRQKGQLKLDNSVIEKFLPRLIHPCLIPEIKLEDVVVGPVNAFSAVFFESSLDAPAVGGGLQIRTKDQDFAISKRLYLQASHSRNLEPAQTLTRVTNLAYVVAECKTNLDKTMFQEAVATAHDVRTTVPGAKYYLLCEWLDMAPISTAPTDIEEVIILRKAKRLNSNVRANFSKAEQRQTHIDEYADFLARHPLSAEMFGRFINHVRFMLSNEAPEERNVLTQGYF